MTSNLEPYQDSEVPDVIARLKSDKEFLDFIGRWQSPGLSRWLPFIAEYFVRRHLDAILQAVNDIRSFQDVVADYVSQLMSASVTSFNVEGLDKFDPDQAYLYISNHRDIAGDSMFVNYARYLQGMGTVHIAVGDNLIQKRFATDIMKLNKSFFIPRGETNAKKMYQGLKQASGYIHRMIGDGQSVWIAQSEGRAKDNVDKTEPAVVKMLTLFERKKNFSDVINGLNIVPVSLSYEFDPCDGQKARELTLKRETGSYQKSVGEDLLSLATGLSGYKGEVTLRFGEKLSGNYESPESVATALDQQIVANLEIFEVNRWAAGKLGHSVAALTNPGSVEVYEARLRECPPPFRDQWLRQYANPLLNQLGLIEDPE